METPQNPPLPTLPMQLMLTMGTWLSSPFASACASNGFSPSNPPPNLPPLNPVAQAELANAVLAEAKNRAADLLTGVLRYLDAPYARNVSEPPTIWKQGNARLLDYSVSTLSLWKRGGASQGEGKKFTSPHPNPLPKGEGIMLFVPSLINRYYILDLNEEHSLLRYLAAQGIYTLVLDWGAPGEFEREFDCTHYVTEILLPALEFIHRTSGKKVTLAGYCMGGVLAAAAAQLKPTQVGALALLATPWDFHCSAFAPFVVSERWHAAIEAQIVAQETVPADIIQSLFYWTDPFVFEHKFRRFAELSPESHAAKEFVALERWVNDGVPMTKGVARECLIDWAQKNIVARGSWLVGGEKIDPKKITIPTLIAIPENDHVVPRDCAMKLASAIKDARIVHPSAGHVGMIVGHRAKKELWAPMVEWLQA
jgi:polyhydroxyalkanoate synthase subunit PhaC